MEGVFQPDSDRSWLDGWKSEMLINVLSLKVLGISSPRASLLINYATVRLTGQKRDRMESISEHHLGQHYKADFHFF